MNTLYGEDHGGKFILHNANATLGLPQRLAETQPEKAHFYSNPNHIQVNLMTGDFAQDSRHGGAGVGGNITADNRGDAFVSFSVNKSTSKKPRKATEIAEMN